VARFKFDVRGVEGRGATLPQGVYDAQITSADITKPDGKDERIELVVEVINNKDHNGKKLYEYVNLESEAARWKLLELLRAVGVDKDAGTLDTDKQLKGKKIGVKTFVRPADDVRGFDEQARIRRMFPLDGANQAAPAEDLSEEVEEEAVEEEGGDEITAEEVNKADRAELKQINAEAELGIKVLRSMSDDDLRAAVLKALDLTPAEEPVEEEEDEEEEVEEEVEEESGLSFDDLSGMDRNELKKLNADQRLGVRVVKSMTDDDLREALAEALEIDVPAKMLPDEPEEEGEEEEGEEAEAAAPTDDYDEWSEDDLREELGDRNLPVRGSKRLLISRLRKDDAQEGKPF
jgi:hypothetical protein